MSLNFEPFCAVHRQVRKTSKRQHVFHIAIPLSRLRPVAAHFWNGSTTSGRNGAVLEATQIQALAVCHVMIALSGPSYQDDLLKPAMCSPPDSRPSWHSAETWIHRKRKVSRRTYLLWSGGISSGCIPFQGSSASAPVAFL